ncbi:MAG TPA: HEAT repeat domain-containing protein [Terracidiphilus sp.]|nr:HEAT repeat domain-containing protein [Terracidiphilus sp.]
MQTQKAIKGTVEPILEIDYSLPVTPIGWRNIQEHETGVLFLTRQSERLIFADPYHPMVVASTGSECDGSTAYETILGCIRAAALDQSAPSSRRLDALWILSKVSDPSANVAPLTPLLADRDKDLRYATAALFMSRGNVNGLAAIYLDLSRAQETDAPTPGMLLHALSQASLQPDALPYLTTLLACGPPDVRKAAALALRNTNSQSAIPDLLGALDDPNSGVRFNVTLALTHITKQYGLGAVRNRPQGGDTEQIDAWKRWAATHGYTATRKGLPPAQERP